MRQFQLLPPLDEAAAFGSDESCLRAERILSGTLAWYAHRELSAVFPPHWTNTPFGDETRPPQDWQHWSAISDCGSLDIKHVWEQSRFGFVSPLMRAYAQTRDPRYAEAFWCAVEDWMRANPPQRGPQWMCGQEVALRAMCLVCGFLCFLTDSATSPQRESLLAQLLEVSGRRIKANIGYALSQQNNHGVSEAAGLFTLGLVLSRRSWVAQGRRLLDALARQLIYPDGCFAQHSTNYHRLMLHVYLWAIRLGEASAEPLARETIERVRRAGLWLQSLMSPETGRVPNLGGNDGAHFLDLTDLGYLDYRPTVQAVGLLTEQRRWLEAGPWDEFACWLGADVGGLAPHDGNTVRPADSDDRSARAEVNSAEPCEFPDGGYSVWRDGEVLALFRCPRRFQHRPAQCDLLHFDLWVQGQNLLRDAGSYSYNCAEPWLSYFASAAAHNTIQFDDGEPMPKLSRFLYGAWPRMTVRQDDRRVTARYADYRQMLHSRSVVRTADGFRVTDEIAGAFKQAVLRWRLSPEENWRLADMECRSARLSLTIQTVPAEKPVECRLTEGWESLYYQQRTTLPVLEVSVDSSCRQIVTEIVLVNVNTANGRSSQAERAQSRPQEPSVADHTLKRSML